MKIKAFEMNTEYVNTDDYLDFDGWDDLVIDGNDDFVSIHNDYNLYDLLKRYCIEYSDLLDALDNVDESNYKNKTEVITDFLEFTPNTKQVHDIYKTLIDFDNKYPHDDSDYDVLMCDLLTICEKRKWTTKTINGYCQGDYQTIFYPVDRYDKEFIKYIECLYFGAGSEYMIETVSDDNPDKEPDYDNDYYCDYFSEWNDEDLKKHIAKDSYYNLSADDVTIYHYHSITCDGWIAA